MAKKRSDYVAATKTKRGKKLRPFNIRKKLGPKSSWRLTRKKKRGQG
jgi:hypothetical protein